MSNPGSNYRNQSEIQGVHKARDPTEHLRNIILKEDVSSADDLKSIEKEIRRDVEEAAAKAKEAPQPDDEELFSNINQIDTGLITYGCVEPKRFNFPECFTNIAQRIR